MFKYGLVASWRAFINQWWNPYSTLVLPVTNDRIVIIPLWVEQVIALMSSLMQVDLTETTALTVRVELVCQLHGNNVACYDDIGWVYSAPGESTTCVILGLEHI